MKSTIFVDGQEGTTGIEIVDHLVQRNDLCLIPVDEGRRKDSDYRRSCYQEADLVILCLPDQVARESVSLCESVRFIDASTAHRTDALWVYGLPELCSGQRERISDAQFVSNPGCYPTGFLLMIRPLVDAGVISEGLQLQTHAVSGYSGGGKKLISAYEDGNGERVDTRLYSLTLNHKHVPEMREYGRLQNAPFFLPSVGPFYRGMTVSTVLLETPLDEVVEVWGQRYENEPFVEVLDVDSTGTLDDGFLSAMRCNHTNRVDLLATSNGSQTLLCAVLDNLGKGASQAAVQNLNLMLGKDESLGLKVHA